jgi:hypothetical protein
MSLSEPLASGSERADEDPATSLALRVLPDPVLRLVCEPVETFGRPLRELVEELHRLMVRHRGIGLAAPQAGLARRLFVGAIDGRPGHTCPGLSLSPVEKNTRPLSRPPACTNFCSERTRSPAGSARISIEERTLSAPRSLYFLTLRNPVR